MPSEVFLQPYLSSDLGSVWLLPELGLLYLSSDLGGVWLFRIHGRGAAFKRLSRLGCAMFLVYALGLLSSFLFLGILLGFCRFGTVPSEVFLQPYLSSDLGSVWLLPELGLLYLSSDLGGVWLFRIHGRGAAFKRLSRLGCAMFLVYALGLFSSS